MIINDLLSFLKININRQIFECKTTVGKTNDIKFPLLLIDIFKEDLQQL